MLRRVRGYLLPREENVGEATQELQDQGCTVLKRVLDGDVSAASTQDDYQHALAHQRLAPQRDVNNFAMRNVISWCS